jgi:hypothetical protein
VATRDDDTKRLKALRRRVNKARDFPNNTCGASRHLHMIADALSSRKPYPMLQEEPEHCAESIYAVIAALWEIRSAAEAKRAAENG